VAVQLHDIYLTGLGRGHVVDPVLDGRLRLHRLVVDRYDPMLRHQVESLGLRVEEAYMRALEPRRCTDHNTPKDITLPCTVLRVISKVLQGVTHVDSDFEFRTDREVHIGFLYVTTDYTDAEAKVNPLKCFRDIVYCKDRLGAVPSGATVFTVHLILYFIPILSPDKAKNVAARAYTAMPKKML
jgi:hypothetical protein